MSRYFISLSPDSLTAKKLAGMYDGIDNATWVPSDQLHLTLKFIGSIGPDRAAELAAVLAEIRHAPFQCTVQGAGTFPHVDGRGQLNVLWTGFAPSEELESLITTVEDHAVNMGLDPADRPVHPHLTVARLRNAERSDVKRWLSRYSALTLAPFSVTSFHLMNSALTADGAEYETVKTFTLK